MKLVVGLGNPGLTCDGTRHNLGYQTVRRLARDLSFPRFRRQRHGLVSSGRVTLTRPDGPPQAEEIVLFLPQTFMNDSGLAVRSFLLRRTWAPEDLVVVCDDLDLAAGRVRIRVGGSSGGHRGVGSVIEKLGTDDFVRVKIGLGRPPEGVDPVDFVLQRPTGEEREILAQAVVRAAEAVWAVLSEGPEPAMNRFNRSAGEADRGGAAPGDTLAR